MFCTSPKQAFFTSHLYLSPESPTSRLIPDRVLLTTIISRRINFSFSVLTRTFPFFLSLQGVNFAGERDESHPTLLEL